MKSDKFSIKTNILLYLIGFSVLILVFLYLFQVVFLNTYYRYEQSNALKQSISLFKKAYEDDDYESMYDVITHNNSICVELVNNGNTLYSSSSYNKRCISSKSNSLVLFQKQFIESGKDLQKVEIVNPNFNNNTLVYGTKIDDLTYVFASTSLVPLDSSITILKGQFIYIALIVLSMSILISVFISRHISKPIVRLNEGAKKLKNKDYNFNFDTDSSCYEIVELSETLNEAAAELAKTDELRRDLMANVSHDLKTPLTMIKAYAEAARDLNYDNKEKREENLNIITEEVDRLTILVNDILDLSKLENSSEEFMEEKLSLNKLIESILKRYTIMQDEGYEFIFNADDEYFVFTSQKRIEQVIYNLINNAINYTGDDKKIIIELKKEKGKVKVSVSDTGKGIDKDEINLVWEKYYRTKKKHKRNKIGTGLGLSIVKNIFEQYNIEYGIISKKKKGTTFYFYMEIKD